MPQLALKRAGRVAYREAEPSKVSDRLPALCIHGWPQSSYMWRHLLPGLASAGRRALARDLPGFGDSPPDYASRFAEQIPGSKLVLLEEEMAHTSGFVASMRSGTASPRDYEQSQITADSALDVS